MGLTGVWNATTLLPVGTLPLGNQVSIRTILLVEKVEKCTDPIEGGVRVITLYDVQYAQGL